MQAAFTVLQNIPSSIVRNTNSSSSPLLNEQTSENIFYSNIEQINSKLYSYLTNYYQGKTFLNNYDVNYLKSLHNILIDNKLLSNIERFSRQYLSSKSSLNQHHQKLQNISILLSNFADLLSLHKERLNFDPVNFRENCEDRFKDLIRNNFWTREFNVSKENYYNLTLPTIDSYFKNLDKNLQKNLIFWFSYSRLHYRGGTYNNGFNTTIHLKEGDCGEFIQLNTYLLQICGYNPKIILIQVGKNKINDNHGFTLIEEENKNFIIDYQKISEFQNNILDLNISEHLNNQPYTNIRNINIPIFLKTGDVLPLNN